jgi:hypothetical protein
MELDSNIDQDADLARSSMYVMAKLSGRLSGPCVGAPGC